MGAYVDMLRKVAALDMYASGARVRMTRRTLIRAGFVALAAGLLLAGGHGQASERPSSSCPPPRAPARPWLVVGRVGSPVAYCDKIIATLTGDLEPRTGAFAKLDAATGNPVSKDAPAQVFVASGIERAVYAAVGDRHGGWFVGGGFRQVEGNDCPFLAHIDRDGALDQNWCPRPDGPVRALARRGNTLFVGGRFHSIAKQRRINFAALNTRTGKARGLIVGVSGPPVYDRQDLIPREVNALELVGRTLYIGGFFSTVAGANRQNLAALDVTNGHLLRWNPGVGTPREFAPDVTGIVPGRDAIYVAGAFETIGGRRRPGAAAVRLDGSVTAWDPRPRMGGEPGSINAIVRIDERRLALSGYFSSVAGMARPGLAVVSSSSGRPTAWRPPKTLVGGRVFAAAGDRIYLTGRTDRPRKPSQDLREDVEAEIVALDLSRRAIAWSKDIGVGAGTASVSVMRPAGRFVFVGGDFEYLSTPSSSNTTPMGIVTIDPVTRDVERWKATFKGEFGRSEPDVLVVQGDTLYAGGNFTAVNDKPREGLAAFDIPSRSLLPWHTQPMRAFNYGVMALATDEERLYVGGDFLRWGDQRRPGLAAFERESGDLVNDWHPAVGDERSTNDTFGEQVHALALFDDRIYVGGEFTLVNEQNVPGVAAIHSRSGELLDWYPAIPDHHFYALASSEGQLYAGGWCIGCIASERSEPNGLLEIDEDANVRPLGGKLSGGDVAERIHGIANAGSRIYVTGEFSEIGGVRRLGLAALDTKSGAVLPWNPEGSLSLSRGGDKALIVGSTLVVTGQYGGELAVFPLSATAG
jgi:trimeric autotransporter adhesin